MPNKIEIKLDPYDEEQLDILKRISKLNAEESLTRGIHIMADLLKLDPIEFIENALQYLQKALESNIIDQQSIYKAYNNFTVAYYIGVGKYGYREIEFFDTIPHELYILAKYNQNKCTMKLDVFHEECKRLKRNIEEYLDVIKVLEQNGV